MKHELSNVSSHCGAPMGRSQTWGDYSKRKEPINLQLIQLAWEDGVYDTGGAYWGRTAGEHIYHTLGEQGEERIELFIRAKSFSDVESQITKHFPSATFERAEQDTGAKLYWFTSGSGEIELQMSLAQAKSMSHSGACDEDVAANRQGPSIKTQLDAINPKTLRIVLRDYGAWSDEELKDHETNLMRILWLAAGDIVDNYREQDALDAETEGE